MPKTLIQMSTVLTPTEHRFYVPIWLKMKAALQAEWNRKWLEECEKFVPYYKTNIK
jgi:hypothetical protein